MYIKRSNFWYAVFSVSETFIISSNSAAYLNMTPSWCHVKGNLRFNINYFKNGTQRSTLSQSVISIQNRKQMKSFVDRLKCHIHKYSNLKSKTPNSKLVVETDKGKVCGVTLTAKTGKKVDAWLGIPFAQPPVGNLRFQRPKSVKSWSKKILDATTLPNSCVQTIDTMFGNFSGATIWNVNTKMSEDCLYLNIYVPRPRPKNAAVLIWIYGGGFYSGTSTLDVYDPSILVSEEQVIVACINYRVASLGFLYLGTSEAPGNVGLFDQLMAMQFIKSNIINFGGNPENITLFGESAGAVSVSLHLLSPLSRNYFSNAIMQSGTAIVPWALISKKESMSRSIKLAKAVHCPHLTYENTTKLLECLRKKDPEDLVNIEWNVLGNRICQFPFVPIVDVYFIKEDPMRTLRLSSLRKRSKKPNILLGTNSEEGIYFIIYYLNQVLKKEDHVMFKRAEFQKAVSILFPDVNKHVQDAILKKYTDHTKPDDTISNINALDKIVGDYFFTCGSERFAHMFAEDNVVFNYKFTHRSLKSVWPSWTGVMHGDEIIFVFGQVLDPANKFTKEEVELSKRMMKHWANFAKTGDPSIDKHGSQTQVKWPQYNPRTREYLRLAINSSVGHNYRAEHCAFWNEILPRRPID